MPCRRINDVKALRLRQFQEDAGPLAHPVQPQSYITIDNFYTATVYEKGAEVIGMLQTIVGPEMFRKAIDLYFERHDGEAATVEDFVRCFEDASGRELDQFRLWYSQAGTPEVQVQGVYDAEGQDLRAEASTVRAADAGPAREEADAYPARAGPGRQEQRQTAAAHARRARTQPGRKNACSSCVRPNSASSSRMSRKSRVLSIGRGFSAPVIIRSPESATTRAFLMSHDADSFNRWEAGQKLSRDILLDMVRDVQAGRAPTPDPTYIEAIGDVLARADEDHAFTALMLVPPSESEMAHGDQPDRSRSDPRCAQAPDLGDRGCARTRACRALQEAGVARRVQSRRRLRRTALPAQCRAALSDRRRRRLRGRACGDPLSRPRPT